jgi:antitoxin component YwqK of YwqJK toxin-antitoxin module
VGEATAYFKNGVVAKKMNFDPATCKDMHTIQYFPSGKIKWERIGNDSHYKVDYFDSLKSFKSNSEEWIDDPNNFNGPLLKHGKTVKYFGSGQIRVEQDFNNGLSDGEYKIYSPTGDVLSGGQYSQGNKIGKWKISFTQNWDETDLKDSIAYYRIIDFTTKPWPITDYFATGEKQFEGALGRLSPEEYAGRCTWYFKNGTVARELEMENGVLHSDKQYYENGKLRFESTPTGFSEGMYRTFNGKEYYENSKVKSEGIIKNNKKNGVWKNYDEKGNVSETQEGY